MKSVAFWSQRIIVGDLLPTSGGRILSRCILPRCEGMISMQMSRVLTNGDSVRSKLLTHAYEHLRRDESRRACALAPRINKITNLTVSLVCNVLY